MFAVGRGLRPLSATTLTSRGGPGVDSGMRVGEPAEIPSTNIIDIPMMVRERQYTRHIANILYEIKHYIIVDLWGRSLTWRVSR